MKNYSLCAFEDDDLKIWRSFCEDPGLVVQEIFEGFAFRCVEKVFAAVMGISKR
jgi:hypothetical protein